MSLVRRIVAVCGQIVGLLLIMVFTTYSGFYAWGWATTIRFISDQLLLGASELKQSGLAPHLTAPENIQIVVQVSNLSEPNAWFVIGALMGFLISAASVSVIFVLVEIMHNTKRTVAFFERMDSARKQ